MKVLKLLGCAPPHLHLQCAISYHPNLATRPGAFHDLLGLLGRSQGCDDVPNLSPVTELAELAIPTLNATSWQQ